jgi:hypothetical protein
MITLPSSTVPDISGVMTGIFTDFSPLILLIMGVVLGLWFVEKIINIFNIEKEVSEYPGAESEIRRFRAKYPKK